ncbi:MAG: DUF1836 domain-containing protein [Clostridia bacterium]|nr:DUF1836 domain-containing protein [Clostridia bacterium]
MKEETLRAFLDSCRLPAWDALPDFGLYMDQMLTYTDRTLPGAAGLPGLTSSMINNYVKAGLIDKPAGKKYSRGALAQLLMICLLKQTSTLENMKRLLHPENGADTEAIYASFLSAQDRVAADLPGRLNSSPLTCALEASSLQLICRLQLADTGKEAET